MIVLAIDIGKALRTANQGRVASNSHAALSSSFGSGLRKGLLRQL